MSSGTPTTRSFVLVGHCGPDQFMLRTAIERIVPGAAVVQANDDESAAQYADGGHVLLVNRNLDGRFADRSGINLIRRLHQGTNGSTLALISNLADAQDEAVATGAVPGFGKSHLYDDDTAEILRRLAADMQN